MNSTYYSMLVGVQVGHDPKVQGPEGEFWSIALNQVGKGKLNVDEAYEAKQRIQAMTSWNDLVDEKTTLVGAIC